jgi:hypothetical protein
MGAWHASASDRSGWRFIGDRTALAELFAMPTDRFRWSHRFNVRGFVVGKESMLVSGGGTSIDGAAPRSSRASPAAA